ncbi:XapX domain-containing protein [Halobacteriales archaeon SW_7_68_16]|nr:MAG: XapX domain-containing protein [Halobacteriales archaeon SW_7_68_16]
MIDVTLVLAVLTGLVTGAVFAFIGVPIPAPPALPGVAGIVGIYAGFKLVEHFELGFDLVTTLGLG